MTEGYCTSYYITKQDILLYYLFLLLSVCFYFLALLGEPYSTNPTQRYFSFSVYLVSGSVPFLGSHMVSIFKTIHAINIISVSISGRLLVCSETEVFAHHVRSSKYNQHTSSVV